MQTAVAVTGRGARMLAWRLHAYAGSGSGSGSGVEAGAGAGAAELRLEEARVPPLRSPTEVLVRVHAASINPLDVAMIGGYGARVLNALRAADGADGAGGGGGGVEFPLVLGRDFVGVVERAGPAAEHLRRGQRVWGVVPPHRPGCHAQYVALDARCVGAAPAALPDHAAAATLYAALSACAVLRAAGLPPGRAPPAPPAPRVLLLGLGGVGHAALQLLVHSGARVTVGCAPELCGEALARGAAAALDRHAPAYSSALVDCGPYEAIVDCAGLGGDEAGRRAWVFGRYATLSAPLLRHTDALGLGAGAARAAADLLGQAAAAWARASPAAACPPHVRWAFFSPRADDIDLLRQLADRGEVRPRVERAWAWREARAGYERAARGSARGKLVLDFTR